MTQFKLKWYGKWDNKTKDWDSKWELIVRGDTVYPDRDCMVCYASLEHNPELVVLSLSCIPSRIDISGQPWHRSIWLHGINGIKNFPQPYRTSDSEPSEIVFTA